MTRRSSRPKNQRSATDIDFHVGGRIRERRVLLGISQEKLAADLGLTFQQVQKYERGANRASASRLFQLAHILEVPITWFFDGVSLPKSSNRETDDISELLGTPETIRFVRAYYRITDATIRRQVRQLASIMAEEK